MSGEQSGASSSDTGHSKPKKTKIVRKLRAAKPAKKYAKTGTTATQDPNQTQLMQIFSKLSLGYDTATDEEMDINGCMNIKPLVPIDNACAIQPPVPIDNACAIQPPVPIDNACAIESPVSIGIAWAIPEDIPVYNEQSSDDDEREEATAVYKPKRRRRKNRKANDARACMIEGAQPIEPKRKEPSVGEVVQTTNCVLLEANCEPKPCSSATSKVTLKTSFIESDDNLWDQDYTDRYHWYFE